MRITESSCTTATTKLSDVPHSSIVAKSDMSSRAEYSCVASGTVAPSTDVLSSERPSDLESSSTETSLSDESCDDSCDACDDASLSLRRELSLRDDVLRLRLRGAMLGFEERLPSPHALRPLGLGGSDLPSLSSSCSARGGLWCLGGGGAGFGRSGGPGLTSIETEDDIRQAPRQASPQQRWP